MVEIQDDMVLLDAEREVARLCAAADTADNDGNVPAEIADRIGHLRSLIALTAAVGLVGAAVKLRRLADPQLGLATSDSEDDLPCLRSALDAIEREIGRSVLTR